MFGQGTTPLPLHKLSRPVLDDVVTYRIFLDSIPASKPSDAAAANKACALANELLVQCQQLLGEFNLGDYIWYKDCFSLQMCPGSNHGSTSHTEDVNDGYVNDDEQEEILFPHLVGHTAFGDCIDEEWLIVYLLKWLTSQRSDIAVQVTDGDGEFLLIECAEHLPDWLEPQSSENRIWLRHNSLLILEPAKRVAEGEEVEDISLEQALLQIRTSSTTSNKDKEKKGAKTIHKTPHAAMQAVQDALNGRLSSFPQYLLESIHTVRCLLPRAAARSFLAHPSLVSLVVDTLTSRDALDMRAANNMAYLFSASILNKSSSSASPAATAPISSADALTADALTAPLATELDLVWTSVRMTRTLFAQLAAQQFFPPKIMKFMLLGITPQAPQYAGIMLGVKLACGLEMVFQNGAKAAKSETNVASSSSSSLPTAADVGVPAADLKVGDGQGSEVDWVRFHASLQERGFYQGEIEGSSLWQHKHRQARQYYLSKQVQQQVPPASAAVFFSSSSPSSLANRPGAMDRRSMEVAYRSVLSSQASSLAISDELMSYNMEDIPASDSEEWMRVTPDSLDGLMRSAQGGGVKETQPKKEVDVDMAEVAATLTQFMQGVSDVGGVQVKSKRKPGVPQSDRSKEKKTSTGKANVQELQEESDGDNEELEGMAEGALLNLKFEKLLRAVEGLEAETGSASSKLTEKEKADVLAALGKSPSSSFSSSSSSSSACGYCGKAGSAGAPLSLCSSCRSISYCCVPCQRSHWKAHKQTCLSRKEELLSKKKKVVDIITRSPSLEALISPAQQNRSKAAVVTIAAAKKNGTPALWGARMYDGADDDEASRHVTFADTTPYHQTADADNIGMTSQGAAGTAGRFANEQQQESKKSIQELRVELNSPNARQPFAGSTPLGRHGVRLADEKHVSFASSSLVDVVESPLCADDPSIHGFGDSSRSIESVKLTLNAGHTPPGRDETTAHLLPHVTFSGKEVVETAEKQEQRKKKSAKEMRDQREEQREDEVELAEGAGPLLENAGHTPPPPSSRSIKAKPTSSEAGSDHLPVKRAVSFTKESLQEAGSRKRSIDELRIVPPVSSGDTRLPCPSPDHPSRAAAGFTPMGRGKNRDDVSREIDIPASIVSFAADTKDNEQTGKALELMRMAVPREDSSSGQLDSAGSTPPRKTSFPSVVSFAPTTAGSNIIFCSDSDSDDEEPGSSHAHISASQVETAEGEALSKAEKKLLRKKKLQKKEAKDGGSADEEEEEAGEEWNSTMANLEREVKNAGLKKSFSYKNGQRAVKGGSGAKKREENEEEEEEEELDLNFNLVKNVLDSVAAQPGFAGPASNLLSSLGLSFPACTTEDNEES